MKGALILTLAVVLLSHSAEAAWWRRFRDDVKKVIIKVADVAKNPKRILDGLPIGKRDIDFDQFTEDGKLTPEEVAQMLNLDQEDVADFFEDFDENGNGFLEHEEFDEFLETLSTLGNDE